MKVLSGMVAVAMMASSAVYGAEASLSLDVASAYVFRGTTYNDGVVLQPGLEVGGLGGLTVGTWGNLDLDDYDGAVADAQFSEVDLYGSYALPCTLLDLSVGYTEYLYPSAGGDADREVGVSAGKAVGPVALAADVYYGLDGLIEKTLYAELSAGTEFELGCFGAELGTAVAYVEPDEGEGGFSHFTVSAGLGYGAFGASVVYIGQLDDDVLVDVVKADAAQGVELGNGYDVEVVGMLSAAVDF